MFAKWQFIFESNHICAWFTIILLKKSYLPQIIGEASSCGNLILEDKLLTIGQKK